MLLSIVYWSLTSPFITVTDKSATDRNQEPGDNPLLFSTDPKGSFSLLEFNVSLSQ